MIRLFLSVARKFWQLARGMHERKKKHLDVNACPFFAFLSFNAITRRKKRSKNIKFLLHVRKPPFHCVEGHDFRKRKSYLSLLHHIPRGSYWKLNKILTNQDVVYQELHSTITI
jgi:hypothetical protein